MKKIRNYLILTFLLTYVSWGIMIMYTQVNNVPFGSSIFMLILYVIGVVGPAIGAIVVNKQMDSNVQYKSFLKNIYYPSKRIGWYLFIVCIVIIFHMGPYILSGGNKIAPFSLLFLQFPLFIVIGGFEEIGWRGLLLPELEKKISPFLSTLILGIIWSVWHLPLFLIQGTYQYQFLNFFTFMISTIAFSFILSIVYFKTRSIFMCIMTHAFLNSIAGVFVINESLLAEMIPLLFACIIFFIFLNKNRAFATIKDSNLSKRNLE
ncbi:CPBP family intramembrane metalloprotease [Bacillus sp. Gen3]|uniref:CPBP family intramembrane glutamic endopeptidase n=1 Tax=Heyndrickxia oleronia TaxID=38875 RepID=UPI0015D2EB11|nr:CPBP family intramembrane metalloprotease [Bacillus sp. Gen3]